MLLHEKLKDFKVFLASSSPRRQALIGGLGFPFEVKTNGNSDESYPSDMPVENVPEFLAKKKSEPFIKFIKPNHILITSDTIVVCDGEMIGKPAHRSEAIETLKTLSGREHTVITGICIASASKYRLFSAQTGVHFKLLTEEEIQFYVDKFEPFDKAGAYGIQEWIGYIGVERINGSYFNVMGLPTQRLYNELNAFVDELMGD